MFLIFICFAAISSAQEVDLWSVQTLRVEGAATDLREASSRLNLLAEKIAAEQKISQMVALSHTSNEVHRYVISAQMAAESMSKTKN